eukprot:jgi/Bigna1/77027/fgenesh1_pg.45_\
MRSLICISTTLLCMLPSSLCLNSMINEIVEPSNPEYPSVRTNVSFKIGAQTFLKENRTAETVTTAYPSPYFANFVDEFGSDEGKEEAASPASAASYPSSISTKHHIDGITLEGRRETDGYVINMTEVKSDAQPSSDATDTVPESVPESKN